MSARYAAKDDRQDAVRLLAPFDPLVWNRRRFELLWGDLLIGWGNVSLNNGALSADLGYVSGKAPREAEFKRALDYELDRMRLFLG